MFDFGNANEGQRQAISTVDGPVLITAGPGTGKTYTLVQRALFLILERGVAPEQILMATFTEKAAKELVTRISNELAAHDIPININEMYIGTFHSICLRIIKENIEYTRIKKNFKTLDDFDQKYVVFRNMWRFHQIPDFAAAIEAKGDWNQALAICNAVNKLTEELVDIGQLQASKNTAYRAMGNVLALYQQLLLENNYLDFSGLQTEAYWLLDSHPDVLAEIQAKIKYLMIDEYQDTNFIQEQIVFKLADKEMNICVVGDDDQGLYRFRGATIRNILEFPSRFPEGACKQIDLTINYRSNSDIVDFYNDWMQHTDFGQGHSFGWDRFRFDKHIVPFKKSTLKSKAVIRVSSNDGASGWHERVLAFINQLVDSGKVHDLNQIAFLFRSVKSEKVTALAEYLEAHGVNVYSPRSDMFFERYEVRFLIGCLLLCFSEFSYNIQDRYFKFVDEKLCQYYEECMALVSEHLETEEGEPLAEKLGEIADFHSFMDKDTDYAFSGLVYQLFQFEPFASILGTDMHSGVFDMRPIRNLALITSIIGKYEYLHRVAVFKPSTIAKTVELFFNMYLKLMMRGGIAEYEDDSEYAPSGCVSFLTIHQSKGMEFPIVVVGSLANYPRAQESPVLDAIANEFFRRPAFEPPEMIKYYDFWRLYYTAYSRAQNLLVLTACRTTRDPSLYFRDEFNSLVEYDSPAFDINEFDFAEIKDVNLKEAYSFTTHIASYEECAVQYKFFQELEFTPTLVGQTVFGTVVHGTIEDIHRAALRNEESTITPENIKTWLDINYSTVSKREHKFLGSVQLEAAYRQVLAYAERQQGDWSRIKEAEASVSLVKPDYILTGKVDLIRGTGDTVEILDFKSEKRPEAAEESVYFDRYKKQLQVYAHIVEEKYGVNVSKLILYYTGEAEQSPVVSFPYNREDVTATVHEFDDIVHRIQRKEFSCRSSNPQTCRNCDFKHYCKK